LSARRAASGSKATGTRRGGIVRTPVMQKVIEHDGAKVTVTFKKDSNPQALFLFKKNLISSILRQLTEKQCPVALE
jgi:hypothetical protein